MRTISYIALMAVLPLYNAAAADVSTAGELRTALGNGDDISLSQDIALPAGWVQVQGTGEDMIIDGNGHTVDGGESTTNFFDNRGHISSITNITFNGIHNDPASGEDDNMGGAIRNVGTIDKIDANFSDNSAFDGGAIFNGSIGEIGSINGTFTGNYGIKGAGGTDHDWESSGAAIFNQGHIGNITGTFSDNRALMHGTVWNYGTIDNITATFENNFHSAVGGNGGSVKITNSKFLNNDSFDSTNGQSGAAIHVYGGKWVVEDSYFDTNKSWWKGGAIYTNAGVQLSLYRNTFVNSQAAEQGGVIASLGRSGVIYIESCVFKNNRGGWSSGAIYNEGSQYTVKDSTIDSNTANSVAAIENGGNMTISNSTVTNNSANTGGVIKNSGTLTINDSEIANNKMQYWDNTQGAGIYSTAGTTNMNGGSIHDNSTPFMGAASYITGGDVTFTNVEIKDNKSGSGGAVHSKVDFTVNGDGGTALFSGNNAASNSIGVFMENAGTTLYLNSLNDGQVVFDDIVDGNDYNVQIGGDLSGMIRFNNEVNNLNALVMSDGGSLYVGKNQELTMKEYRAESDGLVPQLLLDVEPDSAGNSLANGVLRVSGDVSGTTNVVVNSLNENELSDVKTVLSPFVVAENDDKSTSAAFNVSRVIGSPYLYETKYNAKGDEAGSVWYLGIKTRPAPETPDLPNKEPSFVYAPEIPVYEGAMTAAVEQNRYIGNSIARGLKMKSCCGWEPDPRQRLWVDASYETAKIKTPSTMDADISVFTAGLDLFRDYNHRGGILAGYRNGKYDFSGDGKHFSDIGSELKTDSWLGGVYYEYSYDDWRILSSLFGGSQKMDISTDDRQISTDTDAVQYGADINIAKTFMYSGSVDLEPSLGIFYTHVDVDDIKDKSGKTVKFEKLNYGEAELAVKAEYLFCRGWCSNRLYVKPSVIRTFSNGGSTKISGLSKRSSYEDQTLGRIELGGEFALSRSWQGYVSAGHTFGDDYKSYDINAGLNYAW